MTATQGMTNICMQDLLRGLHQPTDVYMLALFTSAATLSKTTTAYTTNVSTMPGECTGTGYTQGGKAITGFTTGLATNVDYGGGVFKNVAYIDFTGEPAWIGATISGIEAALIYNATRANAALAVFTFTSTSVSSGSFVAQFPAVNPANLALIKITQPA